MIFLFLIQTILIGLMAIIVWVRKVYRKPIFFFLFLFLTIYYTPFLYYIVMNGTSYRSFSDNSLFIMLIFSIFSTVAMNFFLLVPLRLNRITGFHNYLLKKRYWVWIILLCLCAVGIYLLRYANHLPLVQLIFAGIDSNYVRPDTSGVIPHWFTMSSIIIFVIPSFYFYFYQQSSNIFLRLFFLICVCILSVAGGNKGVIAYLCIFVFIYLMKLKIDYKFFLIIISLFFVYFLTTARGIYAGKDLLLYMLSSPFRRLMVTQSACYINRIDMVIEGIPLPLDKIDEAVFEYMYGYTGGSAPTYFTGDIFVQYGFGISLLIQIAVLFLMVVLSEYLYQHYQDNLFLYWNYAVIAFLLGMSGIDFGQACRIGLMVILSVLYLLIPPTSRISVSISKPLKRRFSFLNISKARF